MKDINLFIKTVLITMAIIGLLVLLVDRCCADEINDTHYGLSIMGGFQARTGSSHPNITYLGIFPQRTHKFHEWIGLQLENEFSVHMIEREKDSYHLGGNANILLFPLKDLAFFVGAGVGWNSLVDSHVGGILQGGFQFTYPVGKKYELTGNYRFHHTSDPFSNRDGGLNVHVFSFGLRW